MFEGGWIGAGISAVVVSAGGEMAVSLFEIGVEVCASEEIAASGKEAKVAASSILCVVLKA